ncbi:MAG: TIGR03089 family protein [Humibacillus sp.]|nr:TIGR03089 family protein [Humibacillus sp.]MDN5776538.1 TIGR03089 family protein [Humibacillus sp.]
MARQYPADLLAAMLADDPGRPRLTWYDDEPGPTVGERIELSAKVLGNWVNKAGNLLQDDLAAGPGTTIGLDLPTHWRACYWALAAWGVGASVVIGDDARGADVLVTADPQRAAAHAGDAVLVSLPALARSHPDAGDAAGAIDEARELSTHGDQFVALADPEPADLALSDGGGDTAYGALVALEPGWGDGPRVALNGPLGAVLRQALSAWAGGGSVVLSRGTAPNAGHRLASEGVTLSPV